MRVYHWIYILLVTAVGAVFMVSDPIGGLMEDIHQLIPVLVVTVIVAGTIGNVTQQPILFRWFWLFSFWLLFIGAIGLFGFNGYLLWHLGISASIRVTFLLFTVSVVIPGLLALYQYIYRSPRVWQQHSEK